MNLLKRFLHSRQKNDKLFYFSKNFILYLLPDFLFANRLQNELSKIEKFDKDYIIKRVDYYNQLGNFTPNFQDAENRDMFFEPNSAQIKKFSRAVNTKPATNFFDIYEYMRYFDKNLFFRYGLGDIVKIPSKPAIVKSRPISERNQNSVILNINKIRHFLFIEDKKNFADKKNKLVGRMAVYPQQPHRVLFYETHFKNPMMDLGQSNIRESLNSQWIKPKMSLKEHLDFKFILCLEGNDVATNLKWAMSSNSIAVMPRPSYETWFMEGKLIPDFHYIEIKKDYSDVEEKLQYYMDHTEEALKIIQNAHEHVAQFQNKELEKLISLLVLQKYFKCSQN